MPPSLDQSQAPGSPIAPPMPNSIGATPNIPGMDQPMTPEHKAELQELLSKIREEYTKWRSMRFGIQNQANETRRDQLKKVFQMLQTKGVDLNDQKSVAAFLANLKQTAPQHFDAITRALDYLLGADYETQQPDAMGESAPDTSEASLQEPGLQ